ncbi:hypothetical protein [Cohnella sp. REN36]|uniref:hypothetical protein n=1 Tax=Cohnella sp. REN36 TaxID=2887347 RepID=UPI001D13597C|nr:hypothetical protein [Cohnella sp. REN36]MCC3374745.1 hypothetical protein [Cohnella sp. REN36]
MKQLGRKIYYDLASGDVIFATGEMQGEVRKTTNEEDFRVYLPLRDRVPETVGVLKLEYGQYQQDFTACSGYRVDVSGIEPKLTFSYPDPSDPQEPQAPPVFVPPLSTEVERLKSENLILMEAVADLYEMLLAQKATV